MIPRLTARSILIGCLTITGCASELPAGWPTDLAAARQRLLSSGFIKASDGDWSPEQTDDKGRTFRSIWYDPADREADVRLWFDRGSIKQLSITQETSSGDEKEDARAAIALLAATCPQLDAATRARAGADFAKAVAANVDSDMHVGEVELRSSGGWFHHTTVAKPAG